jgi:WD40 repeat protein/beta-lactamase regulating signal transducer with metallopeptidase domain
MASPPDSTDSDEPVGAMEAVSALPALTDAFEKFGTGGALRNRFELAEATYPVAATSPQSPEIDGAPNQRCRDWLPLALTVWIGGSFVFVAIAASRIARFHLLLRAAEAAPSWLNAITSKVATALGVRACPRVRVVDGHVPPLLWPLGRRATVVLSRTILEGLSRSELKTLIAHELAHLRRRDHLVRWLEVAVLTIYWWHPIAWWARRNLHAAEEEACDAWVVWALNHDGKQYAKLLVRTVDLLTNSRRGAPVLSSGLFGGTRLKNRIEAILKGPRHYRIGRRARCCVVVFACVLLPVSMRGVQQDATHQDEQIRTSSDLNSGRTGAQGLDLFGDPLPEGATTRLGTIRFRQDSSVYAVAISGDGTLVASHSWSGDIRLWDAQTGKLLHVCTAEGLRPGTTFAFSPDGKLLAGGSGMVLPSSASRRQREAWWLWNSETGEIEREFQFVARGGDPDGRDKVASMAFSRDGDKLATSHASGDVRIWNVASGEERQIVPSDDDQDNEFRVPIAFSPDGKLLAIARNTPRTADIDIWKLDTGDSGPTLTTDRAEVVSVAFTPDGSELIAGYSYYEEETTAKGKEFLANRSKVLVWNPRAGGEPSEFPPIAEGVSSRIELTRNGQVMATATREGIVLWDFLRRQPLITLDTPHRRYLQQVQDLAISADGTRVVASTHHGRPAVFVWDAQTGQLLPRALGTHFSNVSAAGFFADDQRIATQDGAGFLRTWDAQTGQLLLTREPTQTVDRGGAIAQAGIVLKAPEDSLNDNWLIEFWDANRGQLMGQHSVPGYVRCTALSPDGTLAAVGYASSLAGGYGGYAGGYYNEETLEYRGSDYNGGYGARRSGISVWDVRKNEQIGQCALKNGAILALGIRPGRQELYYVTQEQSLNAWDFASDEHRVLIWDLYGVREGESVGMAFSPNMRFFVASDSGYKGDIFVYDIAQRKHRLTIHVANTLSNRVAIAPDNRTLATACVAVQSPTDFDETIYLWDLETGEQIKKVGVPDAAVTAMSFSSDGKRLVTATEMGTALVWPIE